MFKTERKLINSKRRHLTFVCIHVPCRLQGAFPCWRSQRKRMEIKVTALLWVVDVFYRFNNVCSRLINLSPYVIHRVVSIITFLIHFAIGSYSVLGHRRWAAVWRWGSWRHRSLFLLCLLPHMSPPVILYLIICSTRQFLCDFWPPAYEYFQSSYNNKKKKSERNKKRGKFWGLSVSCRYLLTCFPMWRAAQGQDALLDESSFHVWGQDAGN